MNEGALVPPSLPDILPRFRILPNFQVVLPTHKVVGVNDENFILNSELRCRDVHDAALYFNPTVIWLNLCGVASVVGEHVGVVTFNELEVVCTTLKALFPREGVEDVTTDRTETTQILRRVNLRGCNHVTVVLPGELLGELRS